MISNVQTEVGISTSIIEFMIISKKHHLNDLGTFSTKKCEHVQNSRENSRRNMKDQELRITESRVLWLKMDLSYSCSFSVAGNNTETVKSKCAKNRGSMQKQTHMNLC